MRFEPRRWADVGALVEHDLELFGELRYGTFALAELPLPFLIEAALVDDDSVSLLLEVGRRLEVTAALEATITHRLRAVAQRCQETIESIRSWYDEGVSDITDADTRELQESLERVRDRAATLAARYA